MIVLDTDHVNILPIGKGADHARLIARMHASADQEFATTIITFEEHMRGWLAEIQRAREFSKQVSPYDPLLNLVPFFQAWEILRFSAQAGATLANLRAQRIRVGTLDLKIASIALENNAVLLTANSRDFQQVPGLRVQDWLH